MFFYKKTRFLNSDDSGSGIKEELRRIKEELRIQQIKELRPSGIKDPAKTAVYKRTLS